MLLVKQYQSRLASHRHRSLGAVEPLGYGAPGPAGHGPPRHDAPPAGVAELTGVPDEEEIEIRPGRRRCRGIQHTDSDQQAQRG
jgi:hypothetical protein